MELFSQPDLIQLVEFSSDSGFHTLYSITSYVGNAKPVLRKPEFGFRHFETGFNE